MRYFYIKDRLDHRFDAAVPKFTSIVRPGSCAACGFVPLTLPPPSPLVVRPEMRKMRSMFGGTTWGFCVVHVDLLDMLGADVRSRLLLGTMILENGQPVVDYYTARVIEQVVLRDGPRSVHRVCNVCGALRYTRWPTELPYAMKHSVQSSAPIYEVEAEPFLLREDVRDRIGDRWSDAIGFHEIPIRTEPRDELPAELDVQPTAEQLKQYHPNHTPSKYA